MVENFVPFGGHMASQTLSNYEYYPLHSVVIKVMRHLDSRLLIQCYFIAFFIVGINLFIAVVLDSFEENHQSLSR